MNQQQRAQRSFRADYQAQMVKFNQQGKSRSELVKQYDLTLFALDRCISQSCKSGSFKTKETARQNKMN
ncbi:MAG: hypothetical protein J6568_00955 [Snodgrassella sp.]|nr:hypothetical protein [Snodgrassella sp.]